MGDIEPEGTAITTGDAGVEIIAHARENSIDHIVMGSRGQSTIRELLLGSASQHVLHHALCPVTIVR